MKNISLLDLLIHSLTKPSSLARFRGVSIGKVIQYTFLLILILTAFSFGQFVQSGSLNIEAFDDFEASATELKWLVIIGGFIMLFVFNTLLIYGKVSLFAFFFSFMAKSFGRKAEYRHLWRTCAFAMTWEVFFTIIATSVGFTGNVATFVGIFITAGFVSIALIYYPKLQKGSHAM